MGSFLIDGEARAFQPGDSVAVAVLRGGDVPGRGGTLCLAGDCGNCVAEVDGTAYVRTCLTPATDGLAVRRHPADGPPAWNPADRPVQPRAVDQVRHEVVGTVVIGAGEAGREAAAAAEGEVTVLDDGAGQEVVGIFPGPTVIVRLPGERAMLHLRASRVIVATGTAELQPVVPGNRLAGLLTPRAARLLLASGVELPDPVVVGEPLADLPDIRHQPGALRGFEGEGRVSAVVTDAGRQEARTVIVNLGRAPRDVLARMTDEAVTVVGSAADDQPLPAAPTAGVVCGCIGTTVEDLQGAWDRGFHEVELLKRATLCGTGTCQGGACLPHLRAFVAARTGAVPPPFTARPAGRQVTLGEAAADVPLDAFRRTALHDQHLAAGATMDRFGGWWRPWHYGDHLAEYAAVRTAVSIGDVSTLGKFVVAGPDALEFLQRLYPTDVATIKPGRARYVLLLNERGHVIDDGMICRQTDDRFVLTFTTGGAGHAEMWMRDWLETWGLDVRLMDRTMSLGAINVTGPQAAELLTRVGLAAPLKFLDHAPGTIAGVPCHLMRLSFTGEASYELHHPVDRSAELWRALLTAGADLGIRPHGLQALFALRLEKGHVIIGMDTELDTTPRRLGMDWAVNLAKADFLGKAALERTAKLADHRRLVGLTMPGDAPTEGSPILAEGEVVGHVTSSFTSPTLGQAVMLGWLKRSSFPGVVEIAGRTATVSSTPFYDPEGLRARA